MAMPLSVGHDDTLIPLDCKSLGGEPTLERPFVREAALRFEYFVLPAQMIES